MDTKWFLKPSEVNTLREIRRTSADKSVMNAQKLKERLEQKGIKVHFEIKHSKVQSITFAKDDFKITSLKGADRVFTDRIMKSLEKNREAFRAKQIDQQKQAETKQAQAKEQIQKIRDSREERTRIQGQSLYNSKGLSR